MAQEQLVVLKRRGIICDFAQQIQSNTDFELIRGNFKHPDACFHSKEKCIWGKMRTILTYGSG